MRHWLCTWFGHNLRWVIAYQEIRCIRCKQKMGFTIADYLRWEEQENNLNEPTDILKSI